MGKVCAVCDLLSKKGKYNRDSFPWKETLQAREGQGREDRATHWIVALLVEVTGLSEAV